MCSNYTKTPVFALLFLMYYQSISASEIPLQHADSSPFTKVSAKTDSSSSTTVTATPPLSIEVISRNAIPPLPESPISSSCVSRASNTSPVSFSSTLSPRLCTPSFSSPGMPSKKVRSNSLPSLPATPEPTLSVDATAIQVTVYAQPANKDTEWLARENTIADAFRTIRSPLMHKHIYSLFGTHSSESYQACAQQQFLQAQETLHKQTEVDYILQVSLFTQEHTSPYAIFRSSRKVGISRDRNYIALHMRIEKKNDDGWHPLAQDYLGAIPHNNEPFDIVSALQNTLAAKEKEALTMAALIRYYDHDTQKFTQR